MEEADVTQEVPGEAPVVETAPEAASANVPVPTVGTVVGYVLDSGPNKGEVRAAMVVRLFDPSSTTVNLQVFYDGANDGGAFGAFEHWKTSVVHNAGKAPGTWHWR